MASPSPPTLGSTVSVPGSMHGTLKFIGPVAGKKGIFAGVQLAPEFAPRGKNSGDVDGKHYFRTTIPGSGIFLPVEKAEKVVPTGLMKPPATPKTPGTALGSFNQGGRTASAASNLGALPKPNFSQSMGPAMRPNSPTTKGAGMKRESLPRPASPLRKVQPANNGTPAQVGRLTTPKTRPSIGLAKSTMGTGPGGARYSTASPALRTGGPTNKFSQSLRQSMVTPSKGKQLSPLGPESSFDEEPESQTATPTPAPTTKAVAVEAEKYEGEIRRLKESLEERDRALKDQACSIGEMERSLAELQKLLPDPDSDMAHAAQIKSMGGSVNSDEDLPVDVQSLRQALREKNDRIKALTAEFDNNRLDFRSTIDTLEMASSETERVYEKRVDELLEEVRQLQDRSEDVEGVARQFRQLEELVQELEEGLEDARRGEAEARGENEFLRGEVERLRSEMKKYKEIDPGRREAERRLSGEDEGGEEMEEIRRQLEQKDDEVRGLKAIITEMNRKSAGYEDSAMTNGNGHLPNGRASQELELQIRELKALLSQKNDRQEELENEVLRLRSSSYSKFPGSTSNRNSANEKHKSAGTNGSHRLSDRTVIPSSAGTGGWHDASSTPASPVRPMHSRGHSRSQSQMKSLSMVDEGAGEHDHETEHHDDNDATKSQSGVTDTSSTALWCEICEEGGHDILTCRNMFGSLPNRPAGELNGADAVREGLKRSFGRPSQDQDLPAPLKTGSLKSAKTLSGEMKSTPTPRTNSISAAPPSPAPSIPAPAPPPAAAPTTSVPIENQAGMVAGRASGVIDQDKWCALCERDGHDSVDCPFEDAF